MRRTCALALSALGERTQFAAEEGLLFAQSTWQAEMACIIS
jgi:hypothetical protein